MKSPKQRRREIKAARRWRAERAELAAREPAGAPASARVPVRREALAPYNSYGEPLFVSRGHYEDRPFRCRDCGKEQVWTAAQQQWWYETLQGYVYSCAIRCRACRLVRRSRGGNP